MLDGFSPSLVCATNAGVCQNWFVILKELIDHPLLQDEEKCLWMWLATQCANTDHVCSFNYEQIALQLNKSVRSVHRLLFRLKLMGFLQADIPIWYGTPTKSMSLKVYTFKLIQTPPLIVDDVNHIILPFRKTLSSSNLNLLNKN